MTALIFIFGIVSLSALLLVNGIQIDSLKFGPVQIHALYIRWDNRLLVDAQRVTIEDATQTASPINLKSAHDTIARVLNHLDSSLIGRVHIDQLQMNNGAKLYVHFNPDALSHLEFSSPQTRVETTLRPTGIDRRYRVLITGHSNDFNATFAIQGKLALATADLNLTGHIAIANAVFLDVNAHAGDDAIALKVSSDASFASVAPLVLPLHLHPETESWIVDRIRAGTLRLHSAETVIPYDDPNKGFEALYAHATVKNARYNFSNDMDAFEAVSAEQVEVVFTKRRLNVIPIESRFYGQPGGSTWLNIDFAAPEPLLHLFIDTTATLTPDLHRVIASYGIDLPFIQTRGKTTASLRLDINLESEDTADAGTFRIDEGTVLFDSVPIDLNHSSVALEGTRVMLQQLQASLFEGNVTTTVRGAFDPAQQTGEIVFEVQSAQFGPVALTSTPLTMRYRLNTAHDRLLMDATQWKLGEHNITLAAFDAPIDFASLTFTLPITRMTFDSALRADIAGAVNLSRLETDIHARIVDATLGTFANRDRNTLVTVTLDNNLTVETNTSTAWKLNDTNVTVGPTTLTAHSTDAIKILPTRLRISPLLSGTLEGSINIDTTTADLAISALDVEDKVLAELFDEQETITAYVVPIENELHIVIPDYNMLFSTIKEGWKLQFFSLQNFEASSPLLREYNLTRSALTVSSEDGDFPIAFHGTVDYPYPLLVQDDKAISHYRFEGSFEDDESVFISVNDAVYVSVNRERVRMVSHHVGYDLDAMIDFYNDHRRGSDGNDTNASPTTIPVFIDANDTAIHFSDGRQAIAEKIAIQYGPRRITAQLFEGKGGAMMEVRGDAFYLYGKDLDDRFIERMVNRSHFQGGKLGFYIMGDKRSFKGLVKVDNTVVYDYVLLNNLFAFINTVPALVTFSLPSYESKGITIHSAYADLNYSNGRMNISGINVDSEELDFAGKGTVDYTNASIDMTLSVKTEAGNNARKIPLVGYILFGDDHSVLTTVSIKGPIKDPKVKSSIAKDIVITPFNILKRTLNFPLHYIDVLGNSSASNPSTSNAAPSPHQVTSGFESKN